MLRLLAALSFFFLASCEQYDKIPPGSWEQHQDIDHFIDESVVKKSSESSEIWERRFLSKYGKYTDYFHGSIYYSSDTASWLRSSHPVASNGNAYGIEQNCVYGPLQKKSAVAWKVTMIKNLRITPSVSTETCDVSQPMKVLSDTLSGFRPSRCCDNSCMMYDNQLVY